MMGHPPLLILAVDDEVHILHVVSLKLRHAGYEVVTAENGKEALELALARPPNLVITDYQMPLMSGLELCQKLKEHPATAALPALMLTARGFSLAAEDLDKTNIAGVISKPFSPREILARVQDLIGGQVEQEVEPTP
jgi:two-component system phosphate regulon response regulator PhoB